MNNKNDDMDLTKYGIKPGETLPHFTTSGIMFKVGYKNCIATVVAIIDPAEVLKVTITREDAEQMVNVAKSGVYNTVNLVTNYGLDLHHTQGLKNVFGFNKINKFFNPID